MANLASRCYQNIFIAFNIFFFQHFLFHIVKHNDTMRIYFKKLHYFCRFCLRQKLTNTHFLYLYIFPGQASGILESPTQAFTKDILQANDREISFFTVTDIFLFFFFSGKTAWRKMILKRTWYLLGFKGNCCR